MVKSKPKRATIGATARHENRRCPECPEGTRLPSGTPEGAQSGGGRRGRERASNSRPESAYCPAHNTQTVPALEPTIDTRWALQRDSREGSKPPCKVSHTSCPNNFARGTRWLAGGAAADGDDEGCCTVIVVLGRNIMIALRS